MTPEPSETASRLDPFARADPFARDVTRMLIVFFAVLALDLLVLSLFTGKLRLWFPVWVDPAWETNAQSWVIYSQSYICLLYTSPSPRDS